MNRAATIAGMGLVSSLGVSVEGNLAAVDRFESGLGPSPRFEGDAFATNIAGELSRERLSALARQCESSDDGPAGRAFPMAVAAGREALGRLETPARGKTMLILSTAKGAMDVFEEAVVNGDRRRALSALPAGLAERVARALGLGGAALVVSNACASGLVALAQAARVIKRGEADFVLVVGVDVVSRFIMAGFSSLAALDRGPCRPYDEGRAGLSIGEGAGAVLLAGSDLAPPGAARIAGWGVTNDANHITAPMRSGDGLRRAIGAALERAAVEPGQIDCVNGHGTGTVYNDAMEARALAAVFASHRPPVYSLKGYFGHTMGAAGVIESIVAVSSLEKAVAPATLGLSRPGKDIDINVSPAPRDLDTSRRALSVKSGFGGVNAAVVFEREARE